MFRRVLTVCNALLGLLLAGASLYVLFAAHNAGDRNGAGLGLLLAAGFGLVAFGLSVVSRVLVAVPAIPLLLATAWFSFILLFAPLAWGESNMPTVYLMQAISWLVIALLVASLITVFQQASSGSANPDTVPTGMGTQQN